MLANGSDIYDDYRHYGIAEIDQLDELPTINLRQSLSGYLR